MAKYKQGDIISYINSYTYIHTLYYVDSTKDDYYTLIEVDREETYNPTYIHMYYTAIIIQVAVDLNNEMDHAFNATTMPSVHRCNCDRFDLINHGCKCGGI